MVRSTGRRCFGFIVAVVLVAVVVSPVAEAAPRAAVPALVDVARDAGIDVGNVLSFGNPCVADLNGDGIDDLVIDRHNKGLWDVYLGRDDGTFVPMAGPPTRQADIHDCSAGDFDRDGDVDLYAAVGACEGTCARTDDLWLNGPSEWVLRNDLLGATTYDRARETAVADLNGDGWLDVVVVSAGGGVGSHHNIYWNRGRVGAVWQGFQAQPIADASGPVDCVEVADVTGDGAPDVIICQRQGLLLAAAPTFVPVPLGMSDVVDVIVTDDGRWLVTRDRSFEIRDADRRVTDSWPLLAGADAGLVDFDGDGVDEIVVVQGTSGRSPADPAAHFVLRQNSGQWVRLAIPQPAVGAGAHVARVGDRALILNGGMDRIASVWDRIGPRQLLALPGVGVAVGSQPRPTLAAGADHVCAVRVEGSVWCWGRGGSGQLGDGGLVDQASPVQVVGLRDAVAVAAGSAHSCALRTYGSVRCWGANASGQLGDGGTTRRGVPVDVHGLVTASRLAAGGDHTCAVRNGGAVRCWGDNDEDGLGVGTGKPSAVTTPTAAAGLSDSTGLGLGPGDSCAVGGAGTLSCWGRNDDGQVGPTDDVVVTEPAAVDGLNEVVVVAAGGSHTCASTGDGTVSCFGDDTYGQLGQGEPAPDPTGTHPVATPQVVRGLTGVALPSRLPSAPRSVRAAAGPGRIGLSWQAPVDAGSTAIDDYVIEVRAVGDTTWQRVTDGTGTSLSATVTGLANGVAYHVRVAAVSALGQGMSATGATAVTPATGPPPPVGLTGVRGYRQAVLTWSAPSGVSGVSDYAVQYRVVGTGIWQNVTAGVSAATAATVTGLTNDTAYRFRVATRAGAEQGPWGDPSVVVVPAGSPPGVPGPPTGLRAAAGANAVTLSWSTPSSGGTAADYVVQYAVVGGITWRTFADGTGTATSATVTGLSAGKTYRFRVAATNTVGQGPWSADVLLALGSARPGTPTGLTAVAGARAATLRWTAPSGGVVVSDYVVQYALAGAATWRTFTDGVGTATTVTVTGLTTGRTYRFRVAAKAGTTTGSFSGLSNSVKVR